MSTPAPPRVVVLAGGLSHERDVSLRSGSRVVDALRDAGVDAVLRDVDPGLVASLTGEGVGDGAGDARNGTETDATVFPVLHGALGEDGAIRAVLELLGVRYVGSRPDACRLAFDKAIAKSVVEQAGLRTPQALVLAAATFRDLGASVLLEALLDRLGLPVVVKPNSGGSALGVSVVRDPAEMPAAMVGAYAYGDVALVERFVAGTEVAVTVVDTGGGPVALPAVEIAPDGGTYDFAARYTAGRTEFFAPARLDPDVAELAAESAVTAHRALGLRDLSRTDLVVDEAGVPWFLEVNVSPGMTETSLAPQAVRASGLDLGRLCADLVAAAAARPGALGTPDATG